MRLRRSAEKVADGGTWTKIGNLWSPSARGSVTLPATLVAGVSMTVTATLSRTMPSADYFVAVTKVGAALIGTVDVVVTNRTTTTVTLSVKNTGLVALTMGTAVAEVRASV